MSGHFALTAFSTTGALKPETFEMNEAGFFSNFPWQSQKMSRLALFRLTISS